MIRTLLIAASLWAAFAATARAAPDDSKDPHAGHQMTAGEPHAHDHGEDHPEGRADEAETAESEAGIVISRTAEIDAALAAGGQPVVALVKGVVCDFCALAMNKTFGKREEVAATYVDLNRKTLSVVLKPGASLDDPTIVSLVTKAGYKTEKIVRGAAALGDQDAPVLP